MRAITETWKLAPYASAAWQDPAGRWLVYMRDGLWVARDRHAPSDPRQHGRDQERAFYSQRDMVRHIASHTLSD